MISNNRIHREINNYLKYQKDILFFPDNIKKFLENTKNNIYLKKIILDLQFNNFKKIEHNISNKIFKELKKITKLHRAYPYYSSLGILSAINMPALLIEVGFITNLEEEQKLQTEKYQNEIANSIFIALKNYFNDSYLKYKVNI